MELQDFEEPLCTLDAAHFEEALFFHTSDVEPACEEVHERTVIEARIAEEIVCIVAARSLGIAPDHLHEAAS